MEEQKYDGYYRDRVPEDNGKVNNEFDKTVIRKIAIIAAGVALIITISVLAMQYL